MKARNTYSTKLVTTSVLLALWLFAPTARAGLTFTLDLYRNNRGTFYNFYSPLSTNDTGPDLAYGSYVVNSPGWPTNGSTRTYTNDASGFNVVTGAETGYSDFDSAMQQITNGHWTLVFTNAATSNFYTFTVSAAGMTSNMLPATIITNPIPGAINVPNQPTFQWQGPTNWFVSSSNTYIHNFDFSFYQVPAPIPAAQTTWTDTNALPNGLNCTFNLDFVTNSTPALFVASTPTDTASRSFPGWVSTDILETGDSVSFAVTNPVSTTPVLVAHYGFDNGANLGQDTSGNDYDLTYNGGNGVTLSTNAKAGGAAFFDGNSFFSYTSTPAAVLSTLSGDFSLSFWINTTQTYGYDGEPAYQGATIMGADIPGAAYDLIPAALDGGEIGFNTGEPVEQTLNSTLDVNDGSYHHIVVTRKESTGEKQIYIDGVLNATQVATMNPLSDPHLVAIGCQIDAYQSSPIGAGVVNFFQGFVDDMQLYAGVVSASQVENLYSNPGLTTMDIGGALVARYNFEDTNSAGTDSSGNGNDANCGSGDGSVLDIPSTNAAVGSYSRQFFGDTSVCFFPGTSTFAAISNALSGSFSVTAWVETTNSVDQDYANAYFGAPVLFAYTTYTNAVLPLSITGSKAAFSISDPNGTFVTIHSTSTVNDGKYHFLAATRNQSNGVVRIYVDGSLEATATGTTDPIILTSAMYMGGGYSTYFTGLMDDVRIYASQLSADEVEAIYSGHSGLNFNPALNTTNLDWVTSGQTDWFVESTNAADGVLAAQSGIVTNDQSSTLSVTVTGPGTLTFWWSSISDGTGFDYVAYLDGNPNYGNGYLDDLSENTDWYQDGPFNIPSGVHTISWTAFANGDNDPTEAGFLDEVSFVGIAPITLLHPQIAGNSFQFQFQSQAGFTNAILYRTNLAAGAWLTNSTIIGTGNVITSTIPLSVFSPSKEGFVRVSTQ